MVFYTMNFFSLYKIPETRAYRRLQDLRGT
jgi:hypothetical protein